MMSIDDSMRKRSQSGSNELRERLSVAAVRAKRAGYYLLYLSKKVL